MCHMCGALDAQTIRPSSPYLETSQLNPSRYDSSNFSDANLSLRPILQRFFLIESYLYLSVGVGSRLLDSSIKTKKIEIIVERREGNFLQNIHLRRMLRKSLFGLVQSCNCSWNNPWAKKMTLSLSVDYMFTSLARKVGHYN